MNERVLLADDSLTIQKVIKITLANQPYDITDCSNEEELFKNIPLIQPKLIFLDFNLSDKHTGYELTTKIKSILPSAKVLLLLGTFDSVDDAAMEKCGASDKIVKPFDSNKFIAICKKLIDALDNDIPQPIATNAFDDKSLNSDVNDQWTVNHSVEQSFKSSDSHKEANGDVLSKMVSEWGMSIPGVINQKTTTNKTIDLPPVIGEVKSLDDHKNKQAAKPEIKAQEVKKEEPKPVVKAEAPKDDQKFPETGDLDYPDLNAMVSEPDPTPVKAEEPIAPIMAQEEKPKIKEPAKLLSIESFNASSDYEIEHQINNMEESDVKSIEDQIRDEVEENLWKVDEFEDLKKEVAAKFEEAKNVFQPKREAFDESLFKPLDENDSIQWNDSNTFNPSQSSMSQDEMMNILRSEMEALVKKHVKEYMNQMFHKAVDKVTWEVVPDLAENLIRQEISKISNKILNDN